MSESGGDHPATAPPDASTPAVERYDAFMSYSRRDTDFARALEAVLEKYTPPKELKLPQRHLRVFRDEGDLTGTEYYRAIEAKIEASSHCILLCSPHSATSEFVDDEVRRFVEAKGADKIIPILVGGLPNNEAVGDEADQAAFPPSLVAAMEMPLATDYRQAVEDKVKKLSRPPYENQWFTLLANLFEISREHLEERDRIRQARRRRFLAIGTTVIIASLTALSIAALVQRHNALVSLARSESRQLADQALEPPLGDPVHSLAHALEAAHLSPTTEAETALRRGTQDHYVRAILTHPGPVSTASFRPGADGPGQTLTTTNGRAFLWDNDRGRQILEMTGDTADVVSARFDPTGAIVAVTHGSGDVRLWDVDQGSVDTIDAHLGAVGSLAFAPDGGRIATAGADGFARVWDVADGTLMGEEQFSTEGCVRRGSIGVTALAYAPDGRSLAVGGCRGNAYLRTVDGLGSGVGFDFPLDQISVRVRSVVFSESGERLAVLRGGSVDFWDLTDRTLIDSWFPDVLPTKVVFLEDGARALATGAGEMSEWRGADAAGPKIQADQIYQLFDASVGSRSTWLLAGVQRRAIVWDLRTGLAVTEFSGQTRELSDVDLSESGNWALTASADSTVRVWRVNPGAHASFEPAGPNAMFRYSADGRYTVLLDPGDGISGGFTVWDRRERQVVQRMDGDFWEVQFGPGTKLISSSPGSPQRVWDVATGTSTGPFGRSVHFAFSGDGSRLATWSGGALSVWDVESATSIPVAETTDSITFAVLSDQLLVASTSTGTVKIWRQAALDQAPVSLGGHTGAVSYAATAGDTVLMTASKDSTARIWDLRPGGSSQVLSGHGSEVNVVSIRDDGQRAVTAGEDWTARVWDVETGEQTALLRGHTDAVDWVQYDPTQTRILTRSAGDKTARLWNPETGRQLAVLRDPDGHGIDWVWFEGDLLMTGSDRGTIHAHPIGFDALIDLAHQQLPVNMTATDRARYLGCFPRALAETLEYRWCDRWFDSIGG